MIISGMMRLLLRAGRGADKWSWGLLALAWCLAGAGPPPPAEIWLAGVDPFVRHVMWPGEPSDYLDLFDDTAPWPRAAAHVQVFKTSTPYLLKAPDDALRRMFANLRRRDIGLAFGGLMLSGHDQCGKGIEGYSAAGTIRAAAERVRRLGGVIQAVAMDEPMWFGHNVRGPHACQSSIAEVAHEVAVNVAALRAVFPAIRVGDIEPLDLTAPAAEIEEIARFAEAFQAATGTRLDFVHADLNWNGSWRPALTDLARLLRTKGIPFGIIYDGDPGDDTDEAWTRHATERFETVEADPTLRPDHAILQSWMAHPKHMLPETQAGTMTNLVLSYLRPASNLALRVADATMTGRLTGPDGQPIKGARIVLTADDTAPVPRLTSRHLSGVVPAQAATALLALRLNAECDCSGSALVRIGPATWRTGDRTAAVTLRPARMPPEEITFQVAQGEKVIANSPAFAVVPGQSFDLDIPLGAGREAGNAGYLALIFLDGAGVGIQRRKLRLTPDARDVAASVTDASGTFSVAVPPDGSWTGWRATFSGDGTWRGSTAIPIQTAR